MRKITLTDNSGRWFDLEATRRFDESTAYAGDGVDVSRQTGNSWEHETLFLTTNGMFVLHCLNDRNPTLASFTEYPPDKAIPWLLANGYPDEVAKMEYRSAVDE